jgi:ribosomal protein S12 methylthiotransferase accessory factor
MRMEMTFPGGLAVDARYEGFTIPTDQPVHAGGGGSAPAPFDLFLASLGTCAGLFALRFCQQRGIAADGLGVTLTTERDAARHLVTEVRLEVRLPEGFPEKYREALLRAVDQCTVKRHLMTPPRFVVEVAEPALAG